MHSYPLVTNTQAKHNTTSCTIPSPLPSPAVLSTKQTALYSLLFSCFFCLFLLFPAFVQARSPLSNALHSFYFPTPNTPIASNTYNSKPIATAKQQQASNRAFELAVFYYKDKDYMQMWQYLNQASVYNNLHAQVLSLVARYRGLGCDRNRDEAKYSMVALWKPLLQQAKEDNLTAIWLVGVIYHEGIFVDKNISQAIEWLEKARTESKFTTGLAPMELAEIYTDRSDFDAHPHYENVAKYSLEAADNGVPFAYVNSYIALSGIENSEALRQECLDKALAYPESTFTHMFAKTFRNFPDVDDEEYRTFLIQTAHRGLATSQLSLSELYADPANAVASPIMAQGWLQTAANFGDVYAQEELFKQYLASYNSTAAFAWAQRVANQDYATVQVRVAHKYLYFHPANKEQVQPAKEWLLRAHHAKYAPATLMLAEQYENGTFGDSNNTETALLFYDLAAQRGDAIATLKVAKNLLTNQPTKEQRAKAVRYLESAANAGNTESLYLLAELYDFGTHIPHDSQKALHYYTQAATLSNDHQYLFSVGMLHFSGRLTPQDFKKAAFYFKLAAKQNDTNAYHHLGRIALEELATSAHSNIYKPLYYFYKGYQLKNNESAYYLGKLFETLSITVAIEQDEFFNLLLASDFDTAEILLNQKQNDTPQYIRNTFSASAVPETNIRAAYRWYENAQASEVTSETAREAKKAQALLIIKHPFLLDNNQQALYEFVFNAHKQQKDPELTFALASLMADENHYKYNIKNAFSLYEQAIELGYTPAYVALGDLHLNGQGIPQNTDTALDLYTKGADLSDAAAQIRLASLYASGKHVRQSPILADYWYEKASQQNDAVAKVQYAKFLLTPSATPANIRIALKQLNRAVELGSADAAATLGYLYQQNRLVAANQGIAFLYYSIAAQHNDSRALYALGQMYSYSNSPLNRFGFFVEKDMPKATQLLRQNPLPHLANIFQQTGLALTSAKQTNAGIALLMQSALMDGPHSFYYLSQLHLTLIKNKADAQVDMNTLISIASPENLRTIMETLNGAYTYGSPVTQSYATAKATTYYVTRLAQVTGTIPHANTYPAERRKYLDSIIQQPTKDGTFALNTNTTFTTLQEKNQALKELALLARARYFNAEIRLAYYYSEGVYLEEEELVFRNAYINAWKSIGRELLEWIRTPADQRALFLGEERCSCGFVEHEYPTLIRIFF